MGVNCIGVTKVIHLGPPEDIDSYIQQVGRGGRDGEPYYALLLWSPILNKFSEDNIVDYCLNTTQCRRDFLFNGYDNYENNTITKCKCCDTCMLICQCENCVM